MIAPVRKIPETKIPGVEYQVYDLRSTKKPALPETIDAFIHAAYIAQGKNNNAFQENTESAKQLLQAVESKNTKHKIFLSSLSADTNAVSVYGKQKAAIEKLFLDSAGTAVRAGLVLGNGGLFASMRNYLASKNLIPLFGNGQQPMQYVHVNDLVLSIKKIIDQNAKGLFVIASPVPVPYREFYQQLCASLGKKPKFLRLPFWLAGFMIGFAEMLGMKLPVTKDNLLGLKTMKEIPSADDLKKIGIELRSLEASFKNE